MIPDGSDILEFGCSDGQLAKYVKDNKDCNVFGIDISQEAVDAAMAHLSGGFVANIECDGWEDKLSGKKFDVILFSDVLEHLKEPDAVMKKAVKFLKPDGRVVFSVPNIAHGDIILKLLKQRFDYSELGLLDNTHIHFFGKENLSEFCEKSGLFLKDLYATYAQVSTTEQKDETADEFSKSFVAWHDYTDVYQFVCLAYKEDYAKAHNMEFSDCVKTREETVTVFYDMGAGFSAKNSKTFASSGVNEELTVEIPNGAKALRFDVREGAFYIMENAHFYFDGAETFPAYIVNMENLCNYTYVITDPDPQQIFDIPNGAREFKANANVILFLSEDNINDYIEKAIRNSNSLIEKEKALNATSAELEARNGELNLVKEELNSSREEIFATKGELNATKDALDETKSELVSTIQVLERTAFELSEKKQEIDNMIPRIDKISENVDGIREKFECLEEKLNINSSELDAKLEILNTMTKKVDVLTLELQEKKDEYEKLSSDFESQKEELAASNTENCVLNSALAEKAEEIASLSQRLEAVLAELDHYKTHYFAAINQRTELRERVAQLEAMYSCISRSATWRMTKPIRVLLDIIKWPFKKIKFFVLIRKGIRCYRENGFKYTWKKSKEKLSRKNKSLGSSNSPIYSEAELEAQRQRKFPQNIKFSVIVPLYNTPQQFLCEMIDSVIAQTYSNWELCMADGSDDKHKTVKQICKKYAKADGRIKYKKLKENLGISGNTNACLDMVTGDYISLFDHDDLLHPAALHDVMVEICEKDADFIYTDENTFHNTPADAYCPHFKPDFSPDTLRSYNYICHFTSFKASLIDEVGKFRSEFDGSQDYDMILRLTEKAKNIVHIPKILYYWRSHANSVASDISAKPYTLTAAKRALAEHLARIGVEGEVKDSRIPSTYKIDYKIQGEPLVSILIPTKDHIDDLAKCIDTIEDVTTYKNYEIIVIENNSTEKETFDYYKLLEKKYKNIKVVVWKDTGFNYSKINNFGFKYAKGEHIVLMNNDIEILTPSWIEEMLMFTQRSDVGAAGMMLYYPDDTIQHAGVIIGLGGVAGHSHKYFPRNHVGYSYRLTIAQNLSAVTAAALMVKRSVFEEIGGLDEKFAVAFNDVDFCLRIRESGYLIVWTPYATAYHHESKSRGFEDTPEKQKRFASEIERFHGKWSEFLKAGDPYYNPNLTLDREDFSLK
ncbi:MAG: glycosyltransferase [Clostridia bacterium]|nr:glycosyltransferase [Clostridia bacterium]